MKKQAKAGGRVVGALLAGVWLAAAQGETVHVFENQKAAVDAHWKATPSSVQESGWGAHQVSRGGQSFWYFQTVHIDACDRYLGSEHFMRSQNTSGTVIAVPIGDFVVEKAFFYRDKNRKGLTDVLLGAVVSVDVQISAGAKTPSEMVMQKSVDALIKNGQALPKQAGSAKPGKILALSKAVKQRFGARNVTAKSHPSEGKVRFLLLDCDEAFADDTFVPGTFEGMGKSERASWRQKIAPNDDRGGRTFFYRLTVIRHRFNGTDDVVYDDIPLP